MSEKNRVSSEVPSLTIVGCPIGNPDDITLHAIRVLSEANLILAEDRKTISRMLKQWGIDNSSERIEILNEHTTADELANLVQLIKQRKRACLVSDAGMPVFCDPGKSLLEICETENIRIQLAPGPTALSSAAARFGIEPPLLFVGFPPQKTEHRIPFLKSLPYTKYAIGLYETPYRLNKLLGELRSVLKGHQKVFVGVGLTSENEYTYRGTIDEICKKTDLIPKGPPVIFIIP